MIRGRCECIGWKPMQKAHRQWFSGLTVHFHGTHGPVQISIRKLTPDIFWHLPLVVIHVVPVFNRGKIRPSRKPDLILRRSRDQRPAKEWWIFGTQRRSIGWSQQSLKLPGSWIHH